MEKIRLYGWKWPSLNAPRPETPVSFTFESPFLIFRLRGNKEMGSPVITSKSVKILEQDCLNRLQMVEFACPGITKPCFLFFSGVLYLWLPFSPGNRLQRGMSQSNAVRLFGHCTKGARATAESLARSAQTRQVSRSRTGCARGGDEDWFLLTLFAENTVRSPEERNYLSEGNYIKERVNGDRKPRCR